MAMGMGTYGIDGDGDDLKISDRGGEWDQSSGYSQGCV